MVADSDSTRSKLKPAQTMAEKILARTSGQASVTAGQYVTAEVDRMMVNDVMIMLAPLVKEAGVTHLHDPDKAVVMFDHLFPAPTAKHADLIARSETVIEQLGIKNYLGAPGVAHQVMCERGYVKPGQLVMGSDSHSTMYGAMGAAGAGIGATEMLYLLVTGSLWFQVPDTIRFNLSGKLSQAVTSKDVVLNLIGRFGGDYGQYRAIEYTGEAASAMTMAQRMTIANMGAEFGAKFAMFEADEKTQDYLSTVCAEPVAAFAADEGASYWAEHDIDVADLQPQIACPSNPENVKPVSEVAGLAIDQAYLGSCTNARLEDLGVAAQVLEGRQVARGTRLLVAPASQQVMLEATKAGYVEALVAAGAHILPAGCGACAGLHTGLLGEGEVCLSSTNRNFPGRMGNVQSELYLGSPASVAASAVTGKITDPREFLN